MKIGGYEIQVPFVTTSSDSLKTVIELANFQPGQKAVDLGSGNGRVALELAKAGVEVWGYEIKPELVQRAKTRAEDLRLANIHFHVSDFWNVSLADFDVIYIYGMGSIMGRLEKKLAVEMKPGARFISNIFTLPHWRIKKSKDNLNLYFLQ